jgi:hypothetical protein
MTENKLKEKKKLNRIEDKIETYNILLKNIANKARFII